MIRDKIEAILKSTDEEVLRTSSQAVTNSMSQINRFVKKRKEEDNSKIHHNHRHADKGNRINCTACGSRDIDDRFSDGDLRGAESKFFTVLL
jgi:hypothetical protein